MAETKLKNQSMVNGVMGVAATNTLITAGSNITTSSTTYGYVNSTNAKLTMTVVHGGIVIVNIFLGGTWCTNGGYGWLFGIGVDNAINVATNELYLNINADAATDGTKRVNPSYSFVLKNVTPGSHTFYLLWKVDSALNTATITSWSPFSMNCYEIPFAS